MHYYYLVAMSTFENRHVEQSSKEQRDYANSRQVDSVNVVTGGPDIRAKGTVVWLIKSGFHYLTVALVARDGYKPPSKISGDNRVRNQTLAF